MLETSKKCTEWLRRLLRNDHHYFQISPYFHAAREEMNKGGDDLVQGSVLDDVDTATNICFVKCRQLGFDGAAFTRQEPKKIIFLCEEYFENGLQNGEFAELQSIVTHEMIHWIDLTRGFDFAAPNELFCSEMRANLLSGQCVDNYNGQNELLKMVLNKSITCAVNKANTSIRLSDPAWPGPTDQLVGECLGDMYPWSERPVNQNMAKKLMVKRFHENNNEQ